MTTDVRACKSRHLRTTKEPDEPEMVGKLPNSIETLVVRCPNWVGDIVMATPMLDCLRANFPQAKIIGVLSKNTQGIVKDGPWFDTLVDCRDKSWGGLRRMISQIQRWKPDIAILLPNSVRSALMMRLSGVPKVYGYRRDFRSMLLTGGPRAIREGHKTLPVPMTEYYLEICRWLGLRVPQHPKPHLFIGREIQQKAHAVLQKYGISQQDLVIGLNPGASFGSSKCWPPEYFAELAELCDKNLRARILLFSGPGEEGIVRAILHHTRASIIDTSQDNVDLELLKPLIRRCNILVTNDTGPRHYAVAFDVPVVVVMGPIDPRLTSSNLERTIVIRKDLNCSPCHKRVCPGAHECMRGISPAEVFAAVEKLLSEFK